jgi:hypothetical protein
VEVGLFEIAGSLYLLATAAFSVMALVVGVRLVLLSHRTGHAPEFALGTGVMLTATLGYGVMMFGIIAGQGAADSGRSTQVFTSITFIGWLFHNVGVVQILRFVVMVFRPGVAWARIAVVLMTGVLWGGWGVYVLQGGLGGQPGGSYWVAFSVIGTYPLWMAVESHLYYRRMSLRLELGLANPLVCNRFLLWTLASLSTAASIWTVNLPTFLGLETGSALARNYSAVSMLVTAAFGIVTVSCYWLTFFPPRWYRARVEGRSTA